MRDLRELNMNLNGRPVDRAAPADADIESFQESFGITLPKEYIEFLAYSNGGHPETNAFIANGGNDQYIWGIDRFYHLDADKDSYDSLWRNTRMWRSVLGPKAVPIATDGGGNQIFLDMSTPTPSVAVAVHDEDFARIEAAASFEEFISLLFLDTEMI